jgi:uncharacterized protein HemY
MVTSIITFLIAVCVLVLIIYLVLWVLKDVLGLPIPAKVIQILWLVQMVLGAGGRMPRLTW